MTKDPWQELMAVAGELVSGLTGVRLERQPHMVMSRLKTRMNRLGIGGPAEYLEHLSRHRAEEAQALVSMLTTHHTYFFRETTQFERLRQDHLGRLLEAVRRRGGRQLRIWSAAASRGQEIYSLAMYLDFHLRSTAPDMDFEILGSDIDPESVAHATNGVYAHKDLAAVPLPYQAGHWVRGRGEIAGYVKARPELTRRVRFVVHNALEPLPAHHGVFDLILCRNLFIYFAPEQIEQAMAAIAARLAPSGLFLLGLAESLCGIRTTLQSVGHSIYAPPGSPYLSDPDPADLRVKFPAQAPSGGRKPVRLRVVCVDDSPSMLKILGYLLADGGEFEVVGTAANGREAAEKVRTLGPDLVTLDIHMPEMDGLEYLRRHLTPAHPPVVMVTSVARDDASLGFEALRLGAADYVEKPALADVRERGDEIRAKLRAAVMAGRLRRGDQGRNTVDLTLDAAMQQEDGVLAPTGATKGAAICVVSALPSDHRRVAALIRELPPEAPVLTVWRTSSATEAAATRDSLASGLGRTVAVHNGTAPVQGVQSVHAPQLAEAIRLLGGGQRPCLMVLGSVPAAAAQALSVLGDCRILLEDTGAGLAGEWMKSGAPVAGPRTEVVPLTSFAYICRRFLVEHRQGGLRCA